MKRFSVVVGIAAMVLAQFATAGVGSLSLVDASGLEYFINSDITFSTSTMASGAISDASYTTSVTATTSAGGSTVAPLLNAFDGYGNMFVNGVVYNMNGGTAPDGDCSNRQFLFAPQMIGDIEVSRRVFVPDNDEFCRWINVFTNTGGTNQNVMVTIFNDLGSDTDTVLVETSTPPAAATTSDNWAVSFEDYTGGVSPSPRLGHVFQGPNRQIGITDIDFLTGNDQPFWEYTMTLAPGETCAVMNYVTGQPSKVEARVKCQQLAALQGNALACIAEADRQYIKNFDLVRPTVTIASTADNPTNLTPIPVTVTFSEAVTGFVEADVVVTNATIENFDGTGSSYSFDLVPATVGIVEADIAADVAVDGAGNGNEEAQTFSRSFDNVGPTVTMTSTVPDPTNIITVIPVTVTFSNEVTGFEVTDITPLNAELGGFSGSGNTYYFTLTPLRVSGTIGADIRANVCTDLAGNPNQAATFRREVRPAQSCFNRVTPKQGETAQAGYGDSAALGLALATLLGLGLLKRHRRQAK
ncbi:MAG: hypothetical protein KJ060_21705 [Candidatus Hydrogenedentes bacterium]|nr:hypothetical protein [Candidatus Hydrogenedentota bacterium]